MEVGNRNLLRKDDVVKLLGISKSKYYDLTRQPDFPSLKIGRYTYVDPDGLCKWLDKQIEMKSTKT